MEKKLYTYALAFIGAIVVLSVVWPYEHKLIDWRAPADYSVLESDEIFFNNTRIYKYRTDERAELTAQGFKTHRSLKCLRDTTVPFLNFSIVNNWRADQAYIVAEPNARKEAWKTILPLVEETGADGIELNFGCPHGMAERGMGSAVGQVPEYVEMVTSWCKKYYSKPVIVKLTPNISDIRKPAAAAQAGGADAVSLINTISSIISVDLDVMAPNPTIDGKGTHGGYCGPAVKPIAMNMVAEIARNPETANLPISGIGGITSWRDAAEYMVLGCGNVQVCTAAMTYGFKIVQEMISGLSQWMDEKGYASTEDFVRQAVPNVTDWQYLNLNYVSKASINQDDCISCGRCYAACEDTSHQAISMTEDRKFSVIDAECVACNLCVEVCPVENCITMVQQEPGIIDPRTNKVVEEKHGDWTTHPNNPSVFAAE